MGIQTQNLYNPFEVLFVETDKCPIKLHKNTFFQLAYIMSGEGKYHINENTFPYKGSDLFLLKPFDTQYTRVEKRTAFLFIQFNNVYFDGQRVKEETMSLGDWIKRLEYIYQNSNSLDGSIITSENDKAIINSLATAVVNEYKKEDPFQKEVLQQLINSFLTLVARNISIRPLSQIKNASDTTLGIIEYIHTNIYQPDKLKAKTMADHFNISLNYISEYFKKHTNQTLQQFIMSYRISLARIRLLHSDLRLNEIADELGFTDESHLAKAFKKYSGVSPTDFRKNNRPVHAVLSKVPG